MPTFLFDSIVFGPVRSRRLGVSLGINLLPVRPQGMLIQLHLLRMRMDFRSAAADRQCSCHPRSAVSEALRIKLSEMKEQGKAPDVITYAGNGEPTLHPDFSGHHR
ncbi:MAG: hypothetical protein MZV63_47525 [Marinilabiliales bacterium]|nr:hypothetical protein [Marinilabiliales bacterium]